MFTVDHTLCIRCGSCVRVCPRDIFKFGGDGCIIPEQRSCIDCFHCTAACPVRAISHHQLTQNTLYPPSAESGTLLAHFQRRRSIRHFKTETPAPALINAALNGAIWAPSAKNQQVCCWTVISGGAKVESICQAALSWAKTQPDFQLSLQLYQSGRNPITCNAPVLILVHCPADSYNPQIDAAIALTLAEQLLVNSGLGTCWGGYLCRMINRCHELKTSLLIPESHQVYGVLMVGYPDERYLNLPFRPPATISWAK